MSTKLLAKASLSILFLFVVTCCLAQRGIYEIKYKFYEKDQSGHEQLGQEYSSLIFYYDLNSTSNVMRTRYYDTRDGWVVVEQRIKMTLSTENNKNYWLLAGQNAKFISTVSQGAQYNPDNIVLSKNPSETYYQPDYVFDNANNKGIITSFKVLNKTDIDNNYLTAYKWTLTQPENNNTGSLAGSVFHLIMVTNSNDATLGNGFEANHQNIKSLFKEVANTCNMRLDLIEVGGSNFGKYAISNALNSVTVNPNDVVVFYYSGHGFRFTDQTVDWPNLDLRKSVNESLNENSLNLGSDVYMNLAAKNPRLLMVIGECCNAPMGKSTPSTQNPAYMPMAPAIVNSTAVRNLVSQRGKILVATSKPNEYTWYYQNTGGIFGSNFTTTFLTDVGYASNNASISWENIFNDAIKYTVEKTESRENGTQPQHPIHYYDVK